MTQNLYGRKVFLLLYAVSHTQQFILTDKIVKETPRDQVGEQDDSFWHKNKGNSFILYKTQTHTYMF